MDWDIVFGLLLVAGVLSPFFWRIIHSRETVPKPEVAESPKSKEPRTELEEIFGL